MTRDPIKKMRHAEAVRVRTISHAIDNAYPPIAGIPPVQPPVVRSSSETKIGGETWKELKDMLTSRFSYVRRLAASALGKLAPAAPPANLFLGDLLRLAESDECPLVRQYAVKAIGKYADFAESCLDRLKDIARESSAKGYLRSAAADAVAAIQTAHRRRMSRLQHWCARCRKIITEEEYLRAMEQWGRPYCGHCLDERQLEDINFELMVDEAKVRRTVDGTAVQSFGERRIADFLAKEGVRYVYDERYRIAGDVAIRPDFYLPEYDLYIEYWGMNTPKYIANMRKKGVLYQRAGKKLVSLFPRDLANIEAVLREKLSRYFRIG